MAGPDEKRASAVHLATVLLRDGGGLPVHVRELLSILVWKWTEADGKYRGCRFWTPQALAADRSTWAHEHVVPRKLVVRALLDLPDPSPSAVRDLLERVGLACIVTRDEHDALPDLPWETLHDDPWARYREAGIEVVERP